MDLRKLSRVPKAFVFAFYFRVRPTDRRILEQTAERKKVLLGFSSGLQGEHEPGEANKALAWTMLSYHQIFQYPMIAQEQIAQCFGNEGVLGIIRKEPYDADHPTTRVILERAAVILRGYGIDCDIVIVAHPQHVPRAYWAAKKFPFANVYVANTDGTPHDPRSIHKQTTSFWQNMIYEMAARAKFALEGWI